MISIVISVYRTEKFLSRCLDSVLEQSYTEFEIICVNDASPDKCHLILNEYARKDNRIHIINNPENQGIEKTRYIGLAAAHGEYLMFLDSDDWLEGKDTVETMLKTAEETGADYVEITSQRVFNSKKWMKQKMLSPVVGLIEQPQLFDDFFVSFFGKNILSVHIWGKLYRVSTLRLANPHPMGIVMGEDQAFNMQIFPFLQRIYILDRVGHNYRFGGMTSVYNARLYLDLKLLYRWKMVLIKNFHYTRAADLPYIEMKNILRSDICQRIRYCVESSEEVIVWIDNELQDELWEPIINALSAPRYAKEDFIVALKERDAERIYNICQKRVNETKWQYRMKRLGMCVLLKFFGY